MPKFGEIANAVMGIVAKLFTAAAIFVASMAYNMDKNIAIMSVNLEHMAKAQIALNEAVADHERRIRDLEVKVGRRATEN